MQRLDHINIRTHRLEETKDFYVNILGLHVGERPPFSFPGYWLYDERVPVIHLTGLDAADERVERGTGPVDHVSFAASGLSELRERIRTVALPSTERVVPRNGSLQVFITDPNGVLFEIAFAASEVPAGESHVSR